MANLFDRLTRWALAKLGDPDADFWPETWAMLGAWEGRHSNKVAIWNGDAHQERLEEAIALHAHDPAAAFQLYLDLAENGSVWSMNEVGRCYAQGQGVELDRVQAEMWFTRAADAGYQLAVLALARLAAAGGDFSKAESIVAKDAAEGWAPACFWLAYFRLKRSRLPNTYREVRPLLETAAGEGHPVARALLARYMATGKYGFRDIPAGAKRVFSVSKDLAEALDGPKDQSPHQAGAS